ncbi:hypothetical protein FS842_004827 [Serendipita sp. 407]|nr:hypothetical protein FS842_004827 [Serendipita sp. 407]
MSGYRLTLRALSASVHHHPSATANLRRLYRPAFRSALLNYLRHEENYTTQSEDRIREWNERVDRTLSILHSSATSAGHCTRLMRNFAFLTDVYRTRAWLDDVARQRRAGTWDTQAVESNSVPSKRSVKAPMDRDRIFLGGWSTLGEIAVATENDLRMIVGSQEQRELEFKRLNLPRRKHPYRRELTCIIQPVGTSNPRPRELK